MLESLDNSSPLRPPIEDQVLRTMRQRILDSGFQVLPLGIAKMIKAVGTGRGAYIIAIGNGQQRQAEACQWLKGAQCFFSRYSTTMYQDGPGGTFTGHKPGWHVTQWIRNLHIVDRQAQVVFEHARIDAP